MGTLKGGTVIGRMSGYQESNVDYAEKKISSSLFRARDARDSTNIFPPYPLHTPRDGWSSRGNYVREHQRADLFREVVYKLPRLSASRDPRSERVEV